MAAFFWTLPKALLTCRHFICIQKGTQHVWINQPSGPGNLSGLLLNCTKLCKYVSLKFQLLTFPSALLKFPSATLKKQDHLFLQPQIHDTQTHTPMISPTAHIDFHTILKSVVLSQIPYISVYFPLIPGYNFRIFYLENSVCAEF